MSYKRLDPEDLVISAESVTAAAWSNNTPTMTTFYTSSTQVASSTGDWYYNVYMNDPDTSTSASVQFAIAYADQEGSGSAFFNPAVIGRTPSRTEYGSYRTLVLGDENSSFIFGDKTGSYFYTLSIERSRYKEKLFPASFNLILSGTGTNNHVYLTDNSKDVSVNTFNEAGRVFQVVSGSDGAAYSGSGYTSNSGSYGLFLPDIGTIILNGQALSASSAGGGIGLEISRSYNSEGETLGGSTQPGLMAALSQGEYFKLNSQETLTSDFVFVRARNSEFNYTENPSFISGSSGDVIYPLFIDSPQTFITCIGLYNDANELLAVAKLSRPLQKDFTKELLVRVKLDF